MKNHSLGYSAARRMAGNAVGSDSGGPDGEPARAVHKVEFEREIFLRAFRKGSRADPRQAIVETPLQRAHALPLEAVLRIAGRMSLRDQGTQKAFSCLVVMALGAGEVQLSEAGLEQLLAHLAPGLKTRIRVRRDWHVGGLARHEGGQGEEFAAFPLRGLHALVA